MIFDFSKIKIGGWIPNLFDCRDFKYSLVRKQPKETPDSVDIREKCPPIRNQNPFGSCVFHGIIAQMEYKALCAGVPFTELSELFAYYVYRKANYQIYDDTGAYPRDAYKILKKLGVCSELLWPYVEENFSVEPNIDCYNAALNHQIQSFFAVENENEFQACLADGNMPAFGMMVYESMMTDEVAKTGIVPIPKPKETFLGGHFVDGVGYDKKTDKYTIRNHWGNDWGDDGYFYLDGEWIRNSKLTSDFTAIKAVEL